MLKTQIPLAAALAASLFTLACPPLFAQPVAAPQASKNKAEEEQKLVATLQSNADHHDKAVACRRLAVIGTKASVPALAALLGEERLSHMARFALEPMPDPAAGEALRAALGKLKGRLLVGVINSLGARRDTRAVDALGELLTDSDVEVATAAAAALGRIGDAEAAELLPRMLGIVPALLRPSVADACLVCAETLLAENKRREALAVLEDLREADLPAHLRMAATRASILAQGNDGVPLLLRQLQSEDPGAVFVGLRVARELPGSEVTRALADELSRLSAERQALLVRALGDRADQAALPAVLQAARRGDPATRVAAVQVLGRLGDASVVPVLLDAAAQPRPELAEAAKGCLAMLRGPEIDTAIVTALAKSGGAARRAAIEAAGERHITAAVPELLKAAGDADGATRTAAFKALGETVGAADFGALVGLLAKARAAQDVTDAESAVEVACLRIADKPACADTLLASLPQAGPPARCAMVRLLGQVGGARALQAVRGAAKDADPQVQDAAFRALADWPDLAAAPDLLQVLRAGDQSTRRTLAFRGYVRLARESEAAADVKLKMLGEAMTLAKSADDKKLVLGALGEIQTIESLRLVAGQLGDTALADEAGAAVVKIAAGLDAAHAPEAVEALQKVLTSAKAQSVLGDARRQLRRLEKKPG